MHLFKTRFIRSVVAFTVLAGGLAIGVTGCSSTALHAINQTIPSDTYRKTSDIYYDTRHNLALDVYQPTLNDGSQQAGSQRYNTRPVLIFFYGGSWQTGDKDEYDFVGEAFAAKGYVVVVADYRKWPQVRWPDFAIDAANATAWVQNNINGYGGNSRQLFLSGHSAGAHLAAMLTVDEQFLANAGVDRNNVRGFIGLAGPYDFDPGYSAESQQFFGPRSNYRNVLPINFVDGSEPPMLLLQGGADDVVWPDNTTNMSNKITAQGGRVRTHIYPDLGHSRIILALADTFEGIAPVVTHMHNFMQSQLRR